MANTVIRLKKSSVSSHLPTAGQLEHGEIALNYADGKIFYKDPSNNIQQISGSANTFYTVNANGTLLVATSPTDILTINPGNNIEIAGDFLTDTLTVTANLKAAFDIANAAFDRANSSNDVLFVAAAFDKANAANVLAYNTGIGANNYAGYMANAANAYAASLTPNLAPAFSQANIAYLVANAAFDKANLAASAATINVGISPPTGVNPGALWWDTTGGRLYIYYTDVDSSQWVEASPSGGAVDYQQLASNVYPLFANYSDATNAAFTVANAAFAAANNVAPQVTPAFNTANAAYTVANSAYGFANGVNTFAYGVAVNAAAAFAAANNVAPQVTPAFNTANAAYTVANAAFGKANTALQNTSGTVFSGNLTISQNLSAANITVTGSATYVSANSVTIGSSEINSISIITSSATDQVIDSFATTSFRSAQYFVSMNAGTDYHTTQVTLVHNGTDAFITEYGVISTANNLGTFSATVSSGTVRLNVSPIFATNTIRLVRTATIP